MVYTYDQLKIGDTNTFQKTITEADVLLFTAISGDHNPVHVSEEFAKGTKFGRRIAHGLLTASMFSAALTNAFPTSIYISQYTEFCAPVYIGDTIKVVVTCLEKMEKGRVRMKTEAFNQNGDKVITGEGVTRLAREIPPELR